MKTFDELQRLAFTIAPEFEEHPFYLLRHPSNIPFSRNTAAYCDATRSSPVLRRTLIESGQWRGPGTTIAFVSSIDDESIEGTFIHECGHALPLPTEPIVDKEPTAEEAKFELAMLEKASRLPPDSECYQPWWPAHGADFIRRVLHLWDRARTAGYGIPGRSLSVAGFFYGLTAPACYWSALGDETKRLAGLPFAEIESIKPAKEFTDLFNADVERWQENYERKKHSANC